ncbi:hypothetical protein [uncultured Tateyamaria sp.]|uniref:hypothetical protein n=1 Tax=uncultured Tateyamaria sp. TaxID=455651 RepID=UPI002629729E|nr:hypothetical protein [uncultured Tateyamaria sp.]
MLNSNKSTLTVLGLVVFALVALFALAPNLKLLRISKDFETGDVSQNLHHFLAKHGFRKSVRDEGNWISLGEHTQWPWLGMRFHGYLESFECKNDDCLVFGADGSKDKLGGMLSYRHYVLWSERDGKLVDLVTEHGQVIFPK